MSETQSRVPVTVCVVGSWEVEKSGSYLSKQGVPSAVGILGLLKDLVQLNLEVPVRLTRFLRRDKQHK